MLKQKINFSRLSLRQRLLFSAAVWLLPVILVVAVLIPSAINEHLKKNINTQIELLLDTVEKKLSLDSHGQLAFNYKMADPRFSQPYGGLYLQISTPEKIIKSRSLWDKELLFDKENDIVYGADNEKLIYIERRVFLDGFAQPITIVIGRDEGPVKRTTTVLMKEVRVILVIFFSCLLLIIAFQVGWAMKPLNRLQKELESLRAGKLSSLKKSYPKEIAPVVADLNALVFHYQELLERARNHAGNLSHALKTPIAVLKNESAKLAEQDSKKLQKPLADLQHHIDYHLNRARMAGSMNILSVSVNPAERLDAMSMAFDKVYADRDITLVNELDEGMAVAVEKTDFDEIIGNIIENSYKWAKSLVRVHGQKHDKDNIAITIEDDGPGVPESQLAEIVKRGYRLDETTPGTGLGLNIVSEMTHSYRGELHLEKSNMGGLKTTLILPKAG